MLSRGRIAGPAALVLATLLLLVFAAPSPAPVAPRKCGDITVKNKRYLVKADQVKCSTAKDWSRRYLKGDGHPKGYSCSPGSAGSQLKFRCWKHERTYFAIKR